LRASLRSELLLGELPSSAYVSLRISADGETASGTARVWREAVESTQRLLTPELARSSPRQRTDIGADQVKQHQLLTT